MFIRIQCQATWICQNTSIFIQRQAMWNHTLQYLQVKADFGSSLASHCVVLAQVSRGKIWRHSRQDMQLGEMDEGFSEWWTWIWELLWWPYLYLYLICIYIYIYTRIKQKVLCLRGYIYLYMCVCVRTHVCMCMYVNIVCGRWSIPWLSPSIILK